MKTWGIHIQGRVQGVGFRPFIYLLAKQFGVFGFVSNTLEGVHIVINASEDLVNQFIAEIRSCAPNNSIISHVSLQPVEERQFCEFVIRESDEAGIPDILVTPDFGLCPKCKDEIADSADRRYQYAFTTCIACGPRYSIMDRLPYDRHRTTMESFAMCPSCSVEYHDPLNRRYYSQTNSCQDCGITMTLFDNKQNLSMNEQDAIFDHILSSWDQGKIVAIQGIGGFLLTCDAQNAEAVDALRRRKFRPDKPFAVMYGDVPKSSEYTIHQLEREELINSVSPIVLLSKAEGNTLPKAIAPGLDKVGVMLPYAPLFQILLNEFDHPIIATSGNVSEAPIVYQVEKWKELLGIADVVIRHNRRIIIPQDDSVIQFSPFNKNRMVIRRSRGLAPSVLPDFQFGEKTILATGALLKSTFSLYYRQKNYVSQYLGDLDHWETQENYKNCIDHFHTLFKTTPEVILCDLHPGYYSSQIAVELARQWNCPVIKIQHHLAHLSAVLAENQLIHTDAKILGVIWDGLGLGDDGELWGGEFFIYQSYSFTRQHHIRYFDILAGDKMMKEPRLSALSVLPEDQLYRLQEKFTSEEWRVYIQLRHNDRSKKTSSIGRLFDAVACLLDILDKQTFEGQAAMYLEALARKQFRNGISSFWEAYPVPAGGSMGISIENLMYAILEDLDHGISSEKIAAKFHCSLVDLIGSVAMQCNIAHIACSGGVFQNGLLVDLILFRLGEKVNLYFHDQFSPNDESISFGQLAYYHIQERFQEKQKVKNYVLSDSR